MKRFRRNNEMVVRIILTALVFASAITMDATQLNAMGRGNNSGAGKGKKPNILLIAIDDLNDWIGCLGGHSQAKTPNMDRLASRGVLFSNAHCQSPVCNPSRASLMTSLYPSTSGIYFLDPDLEESPVARKNKLMPQRFKEEGYHVIGAGKLFHNGGGQNEKYVPNYGGQFGGFGPRPKKKISPFPGHPLWDWGVYPERDEQMPDHQIASWAEEQLAKKQDLPLWMGVGFYRPHVPQFAPQKWFDMYPLEKVKLPKFITNDLKDISRYGIDITRLKHVSPTHKWVIENKQWKPLVQSYLACISFVDAQVGRVLDALEDSEYADNTYVVLFSDHGFHIGEKERHAKRSLWKDGASVPMIIAGPGIARGRTCDQPVQLLDIYPTLLDLTGQKPDPLHEGHSLAPLLKHPDADWPHMARTSFGPGNYAIISKRYRFIQYNDGSEEFYDHVKDPHEWKNLIANPKYAKIIKQHRQQVPKERYKILGEGSTGHLSYSASEKNRKSPEMWYEDNNQARSGGAPPDFKEKFEKPETWARARQAMDTYMIRANSLLDKDNEIDENFIRQRIAPLLKAANLPIAIDAGGATFKGAHRKQGTMEKELELIAMLQDAGIGVRSVSLQSVLSKPLIDSKARKRIPYPMDKRFEDVLEYFQKLKRRFPDIEIGIIDALPPHDEDFESAYRGLKEKLAQYDLKLDHIILDCPFELPEENLRNNSWAKIKAVESYVKKKIDCDFGLVCTSKTAGYESDQAYHETVLKIVDRCRSHRIEPDFFLMMSWFPHPKRSIPDDAPEGEYPSMKTFLEFAEKYTNK